MPNEQIVHWATVLDYKDMELHDNNPNAAKASLLQINPHVEEFSTGIQMDPISKAGDQDVQA